MKRLLHRILFTLTASALAGSLVAPLSSQENNPAVPEKEKASPVAPAEPDTTRPAGDARENAHEEQEMKAVTLVAMLTPTKGNEARGVITFETLENDQVRVTARVSGLKADAKHAMHVHEFGDLSAPDGSSAGGHFNPAGTDHGLPDSEVKHPGDFGNLQADAEGNANLVLTVKGLSLVEGKHAILGRAVVVHAGEDKGTQPSGDAGDRIAHGIIAIANPDSIQHSLASDPQRQPDPNAVRPTSKPAVQSDGTTPAEEIGEVAEEIGRGAEKAARVTAKAVERGVEEAGQALRKAGKTIEKAVE